MNGVFQLLDSSCVVEEEEEEAGLGAPKQTEGLCIVLSVSVLHPPERERQTVRATHGHINPELKNLHRRIKRGRICDHLCSLSTDCVAPLLPSSVRRAAGGEAGGGVEEDWGRKKPDQSAAEGT